jgi:DNA-binding transcriptional LysR family regulator
MRHTFAQLEAFFWVARTGGFRAAAARLNLTQPTVSQRVRELEAALGCTLFDRSGYRARLTRLGTDLLGQAERILALARELESHGPGELPFHGLLRIGASDLFAMTCLSEFLMTLEARHPQLKIEVAVRYSQRLAHQLDERELDLAFLTDPEVTGDVVVVPLGSVELAWVASPRMALPDRRLRPADLADVPILTNPLPSNLYTSIYTWFAADDAVPRRVSTCDSLPIMAQLVGGGFAISLLPVRMLDQELASGRIRRLEVAGRIASHTLCLAWRTAELGGGIESILATVREVLDRTSVFNPSGADASSAGHPRTSVCEA